LKKSQKQEGHSLTAYLYLLKQFMKLGRILFNFPEASNKSLIGQVPSLYLEETNTLIFEDTGTQRRT
jgi:hypothetical protein